MQHLGDHLSSKAGALQHVEAACQLLRTFERRDRRASRQFAELVRRQAKRSEILLDEHGAVPKWEADVRAACYQPRQADFDGSVEPVERFEHLAVSLNRKLRFEQAQLPLETSMDRSGLAFQL